MELNIVIAGVGGQGTLLASRLLGNLALLLQLDVRISEVHGMSQRGGSVITYVRMGREVRSPLVEQGGADYMLAFEELEALRALPYVKKGGRVIMNTQRILPLPVIVGAAKYPENAAAAIAEKAELVAVDALPLARRAGNEKAVNTVLMGALAARLPEIPPETWRAAVGACVPGKVLEANLRAFDEGLVL